MIISTLMGIKTSLKETEKRELAFKLKITFFGNFRYELTLLPKLKIDFSHLKLKNIFALINISCFVYTTINKLKMRKSIRGLTDKGLSFNTKC